MTTGARRGELCTLRWDAVDLDRAALTLRSAIAQDACGLAPAAVQPAQAKGAKWPLRVPVESFH